MEKSLRIFLEGQKVLTLATTDENNDPWVANVYYSLTKTNQLFFASSPDTNHSKHVFAKGTVAFSVSWFNPDNIGDRVAVQGKGICEKLTDPITAIKFLKTHYSFFPTWGEVLTNKQIREQILNARFYVITPTYIKFWNDTLFTGEKPPVREFFFEAV